MMLLFAVLGIRNVLMVVFFKPAPPDGCLMVLDRKGLSLRIKNSLVLSLFLMTWVQVRDVRHMA